MRQNGKLCILRLSAIGDICHAVAMVQGIQTNRPDIEITWIIGKVEHRLVGDLPGVEFVVFDKSKGKTAYLELRQAMHKQVFDVLFLMQVALRANIASLFITAKTKIGFDHARSKELHRLFIDKTISPQLHPHVLEGFMAFATSIGIPPPTEPCWHIPIPQQSLDYAQQLIAQHGDFAVICPCASNPDRNWLVASYVACASYLHNKGLAVLLCGGPAQFEQDLAADIARHPAVTANLVGKTSLKDLLAVLKLARLVIAPDTGPAHMATAVNTPVIGLYAHSNPRRTGPYNSLARVVSVYDQEIERQKGKPWQSLPWGTRAKGSSLMQLIQVEQVQTQIDQVLNVSDS